MIHVVINNQQVINLIYGDDLYTRSWIMDYLNNEVNSLLMSPLSKNIKNISYSIEENDNNFNLVKTFKELNNGYIYNTSSKKREIINNIYYLIFDGNVTTDINKKNDLYVDINHEINKHVLKDLDQTSLYQIIIKIQENINLKNTWSKYEYTNMVIDTIKNFKKELYSSIAKKLKRYGNYQKDN